MGVEHTMLARLACYQHALVKKIRPVDPELASRQKPGQLWYPKSPVAALRAKLILEEAHELAEALTNGASEAEVLKETADVLVVTLGTSAIYEHPIYEAFFKVMDDNFRRIEESTVREDGKLIKPINYPKLNLQGLL